MKIKLNIPGFGERYCSDNVEYKLSSNGDCYVFYKKGTSIQHNEYGPVREYKNKSYAYFINHKFHRLSGYAYNNLYSNIMTYYIIGKFLGYTKEEFIKNMVNFLIPINKYNL